jgi:hypothetical protein
VPTLFTVRRPKQRPAVSAGRGKLPVKRPAGDGVEVVNAFVPSRAEVAGMRRAAVRGQVGGAAQVRTLVSRSRRAERRGLRPAERRGGVKTPSATRSPRRSRPTISTDSSGKQPGIF